MLAASIEHGSAEFLTLCVQIELFANYVFVDAVAQVLSETIGERQQEIVDTLLLDYLGQNPARLSTIILTQELADPLYADLSLKIYVEIPKQIFDELLHAGLLDGLDRRL